MSTVNTSNTGARTYTYQQIKEAFIKAGESDKLLMDDSYKLNLADLNQMFRDGRVFGAPKGMTVQKLYKKIRRPQQSFQNAAEPPQSIQPTPQTTTASTNEENNALSLITQDQFDRTILAYAKSHHNEAPHRKSGDITVGPIGDMRKPNGDHYTWHDIAEGVRLKQMTSLEDYVINFDTYATSLVLLRQEPNSPHYGR